MHELSIAVNIVEIAEESTLKEGATIVNEIELEIGNMSGVVLEAMELALESAVKGTMLEKAKVKITTIPGKAKCSDCGAEFEIEELYAPCPECGNPFADIIQGKELKVKSLKVE
ncbi:MAG: hydrogenase maturation nickel metallochaperone HypA [Chlorobi bacterium]|nr:hydrogenase maturation nickel metallochaperone HypA [Chlorobiota bacterium]